MSGQVGRGLRSKLMRRASRPASGPAGWRPPSRLTPVGPPLTCRPALSRLFSPASTRARPPLRAADAWVRAPDEDNRNAALAIANAADQRAATTWLAFAAAWSGGSITRPDQKPMAAPPTACAKAAHTAVILAATAGDPLGVVQRIAACAEAGSRFADGGDATVAGPKAPAAETRTPRLA